MAFKHPQRYRSVSAFAPIVAPSRVPWGEKAFSSYLGDDRAVWKEHDACALVGQSGWASPILIDQGQADEFLETQLKPDLFVEACNTAGVPLNLRRHDGYDHSYYFISTFMGEHITYHAQLMAPA